MYIYIKGNRQRCAFKNDLTWFSRNTTARERGAFPGPSWLFLVSARVFMCARVTTSSGTRFFLGLWSTPPLHTHHRYPTWLW